LARKALLLALDTYQDPGLKLEAPRNDVALVAETLALLGYRGENVIAQYSSKEVPLTKTSLRRSIRQFFKNGTRDDDLLLYLSGHGVDQDGSRLVVPVDYYRDDPQPPSELISDHWLYGQARQSLAASILIIVDTCREGVKVILAPDVVGKGAAGADEAVDFANAPTIAILYSSRPGEFSWAKGGVEATSFFTEALCEVLRTDEQVATLEDLLAAVNRYLPKILPDGRHQIAFFDERLQIPGRRGPAPRLIVKEDQAARLREKIDLSHWCKLAIAAPYWSVVSVGGAALAVQLKILAVRAEDLVNRAAALLPQDRWRSEAILTRFLSRLEDLVPATEREPGEAAVCLAIPFVYEAILAGLVIRLAETTTILDPSKEAVRQGPIGLAARAWRQAVEQEEDWARRREHLRRADNVSAATDVLCWQLWSFAHRAGELWAFADRQPPGAIGWVNDILSELFAPAPFPNVTADRRVMEILNGRRLVRLARLMFAEPEDIEGETERGVGPLARDLTFGSGADLWRLDEVEVAHVSALAGRLALDARRLPDFIAEHLGLDPTFDLNAVQAELNRAVWQRLDDTLVLMLDTPHPAVHASLIAQVGLVEGHRHRIGTARTLHPALAALLPRAIQDTKLRPASDAQERPLFDARHLRFSLDQKRIISLLMEEALYGDPKLAIRELYQNALDACRYRRAREQFMSHGGRANAAYEERITLEAGIDKGRAFIMCEDNGIGMTEQHLRELFARAGRRFTDSHEYHLDQAQWKEVGISFWPNSRFGIGVLSYFMLAEEMLLESRRLDWDGSLSAFGVIARVTGSGSLFRITHDRAVQRGGGTRLTLFLKDAELDPDDLLGSVLDWLWLPEIETNLRWSRHGTGSTKTTRLRPGEPTLKCREHFEELLPVPTSVSSVGQARVFWIPGRSPDALVDPDVLVDGIRSRAEGAPLGILVNLTEDIAGTVSVDRRNVTLPHDFEVWLHQSCISDNGGALLGWSEISVATLANAANLQPALLIDVDRKLRQGVVPRGGKIRFHLDNRIPTSVGISIADPIIINFLSRGEKAQEVAEFIVAPRLAQLADARYPLPDSIDSFVKFIGHTAATEPLSLAQEFILKAAHESGGRLAPTLGVSDSLKISDLLRIHLSEIVNLSRSLMDRGLVKVDLELLARLGNVDRQSIDLLRAGESTYFDKLSIGELASAAIRLNQTPMAIASLAKPLYDLGIVDADLAGFAQVESISSRLEVLYRWHRLGRGRITVADLFWLAHQQGLTMEELVEAGKPLTRLGLIDVDLAGALEISKREPRTFALLSRNFDGSFPYVYQIEAFHLLKACFALHLSPAEIAELARPLAEYARTNVDLDKFALLNPPLTELEPLIDPSMELNASSLISYAITKSLSIQDLGRLIEPLNSVGLTELNGRMFRRLNSLDLLTVRMLSRDWDAQAPYLSEVDKRTLNMAMVEFRMPPDRVNEIARLLVDCGLASDFDESIELDPVSPFTRRMLARHPNDRPKWPTGFTALRLAIAAHVFGVSVEQLAPALIDLERCGVDVTEANAFVRYCQTSSARSTM
jgi:DNA-binding transcriptional ArsR family regulator